MDLLEAFLSSLENRLCESVAKGGGKQTFCRGWGAGAVDKCGADTREGEGGRLPPRGSFPKIRPLKYFPLEAIAALSGSNYTLCALSFLVQLRRACDLLVQDRPCLA